MKRQIFVDEGGVRQVDGNERRYLPFATMVDVSLETHVLRSASVDVTLASGAKETVFAGAAALEIHRALAQHLATRSAHGATGVPPDWARSGRTLATWLAALTPASEGYRVARDASQQALGLLEDADAEIEARAAAVHLLLRETEGDLVRVAKVVVGRALPPLVVVVARLGGGSAFVADDVLAEAVSFLEPADRAEVTVLAARAAIGDERSVAAVNEARRELAAEARRSASTPPGARARRSAAGTDRDTSRWIGRSWGL